MKKIVLFGGTFDPIHDGHIKAIKFIKRKIKNSIIYVIPAKNPRWKKPSESINHRFKMVKLALNNVKNVYISNYEIKNVKSTNYTIDTINYFDNKFKNKKIYLLIGSDLINNFQKWKSANEIIKKTTLICLERNKKINSTKIKNIKYFTYENIQISSSMIRNLQKINIPDNVLKYITEKHLYFIKKIKKYYTKKRLKHALSVAMLAYNIAKKNKINNYYKCYISGLLHDVAKKISFTKQKQLISKIDPKNINIHKNLYHQIIGSYIAKKIFKIKDKEILDAIKFHTTGKKNFSPIGKILFIADKLDPLRNIKNSKKLIKDSFKNYNNVYNIIINYSLNR